MLKKRLFRGLGVVGERHIERATRDSHNSILLYLIGHIKNPLLTRNQGKINNGSNRNITLFLSLDIALYIPRRCSKGSKGSIGTSH